MSYSSAMGAYYTFTPGQVYGASGLGVTQPVPDFNADQVWADVQLGASCYEPGNMNYSRCQNLTGISEAERQAACGKCNAAGGRAARAIQSGLNYLGYGTLMVDGVWGPASQAAWKRFMDDNNLSTAIGLIQRDGVMLMGKKLDAARGGTTPSAAPSKAGMGLGLLALLVVGTVGAVAYTRRRRSPPGIKGRL